MQNPTDRRRAYFNLHKRVFSIKNHERGSEQYGRVVRHTNDFILTDVTFVVSEAGRARVLRERSKNVHAYVQGFEAEGVEVDEATLVEVTYNPYKAGFFRVRATDERIDRARVVIGRTNAEGVPRLLAAL